MQLKTQLRLQLKVVQYLYELATGKCLTLLNNYIVTLDFWQEIICQSIDITRKKIVVFDDPWMGINLGKRGFTICIPQ